MKITHYFCRMRLEGGGPVRGVMDLTAAMRKRGHDVRLVTTDDKDVPDAWKQDNDEWPRVQRIAAPALGGALFAPTQRGMLREAFKDSDVVHVHGVWTPSNTQVAKICQSLGVPYVWSLRGTLDDWCMGERGWKKRAFLALGARSALERAACCHLTAEDELRQSKPWFPRGRGTVIPNLLDLSAYADLPGPDEARAAFPQFKDDRPVALFLSRLHYKKGIPLVIDAMNQLRERGVDITLLLAGSGDDAYQRELAQLITSRNLQDRVHLIGFVSGSLKLSLYQAADLFVLPTSQENFGFVLFESLACGTPLVTTKGVDTWPELEASGGAVIVDADAGQLADSMGTLLADPQRLDQMGRAGKEWVTTFLDPETIAARFEGLYQQACEG
jgi:glycosyltransferase involved in cell wall biosynthesis